MFFKGMYRTVQVHAGTEFIKNHGSIIVYGALCVSAYYHWQWRIQGGGGQGSGPPPLLGHDVGFLTLGPKLDPPPFFACRPKMGPSGGSRVCVTGVITPPPPLECG